jgi:hypothetical protein
MAVAAESKLIPFDDYEKLGASETCFFHLNRSYESRKCYYTCYTPAKSTIPPIHV